MTESDAKLLTERIGECWHSKAPYVDEDGNECGDVCMKCSLRGNDYDGELNHRTFITPDDQHAVMEAIDKQGRWGQFVGYVLTCRLNESESLAGFCKWLFLDPARFCQLTADAIKEGI